ncbi:Phosphoribosylformimino-5-aminoimidazole carboxamide ribotide isomerase [hydrothermal vent metagenome]|uniref:1-(5-phosphoribosyl)-5-[(5-phosphoribosylamino)methylideneamino]imidazole-4-carboxamideisomerase n=1 Tax=hydrothermal vent metagenome TaxID=652676 RepID=A0A3B0S4D6_9ZZZZ
MIWPAIDLMNGQCVRLHKGDFSQTSLYDTDPVARALAFAKAGAKFLHVVDLDGAKAGASSQSKSIVQLAKLSGLVVQAGGGIRSAQQIEFLLQGGVARIILGSLAVSKPEQVKSWIKEFGADKIVLALDVRIENELPVPAVRGWQDRSDTDLWQVLDGYADCAAHLLVTDIDRDGVLAGANTELYAQIKRRFAGFSLLASGGIGGLDDVQNVRASGADGVIIGKALYENKFTLKEALACWPDE